MYKLSKKETVRHMFKNGHSGVMGFISGLIASVILGYFALYGGDFYQFLSFLRATIEFALVTHFLFCSLKKDPTFNATSVTTAPIITSKKANKQVN